MSEYFVLGPLSSVRCETVDNDEYWYQILHKLGRGGSSKTYLAVCTDPRERKGELVAIKFFVRYSKPERMANFKREFDFLSECTHPSIMRVHHIGEYEELVDRPFIVAEYLPNTLREAMRKDELSKMDKARYATQLCSALHYLHSLDSPIIHRDIKPENIFIREKGAVLGDFGLIKRFGGTPETEEERLEMFKESPGLGFPLRYRTPDQVAYLKGEAELTPASDVFQLGLVLAELFTGWNPLKAPPITEGRPDWTAPVQLYPVKKIRGTQGLNILRVLKTMLRMEPEMRPSPGSLADRWEMLFKEIVRVTGRLEGWEF
ncbi:MAG: serine/threonine protein kinase [Candidatus Thorarchaeota archaeon]